MPKHSSSGSKSSELSVRSDDLTIIRKILAEYIPHATVWAFGSRVQGTQKEYSDLDLAIIHPEPLNAKLLAKLRLAFEESDLPFKVDIVEFASASPRFRDIIASSKIEIQRGTKE